MDTLAADDQEFGGFAGDELIPDLPESGAAQAQPLAVGPRSRRDSGQRFEACSDLLTKFCGSG